MEGRGVWVTMVWNVQCDLWCSLDVIDCPTYFINNSCHGNQASAEGIESTRMTTTPPIMAKSPSDRYD